MWFLPLSVPQKIGVVLYGFAAGLAAAIGTSIAGCLMGVVLALIDDNIGLIHLGEARPWMPITGLFYGFYIGIVVGLIVWWRVCASRFRKEASPSTLTGE